MTCSCLYRSKLVYLPRKSAKVGKNRHHISLLDDLICWLFASNEQYSAITFSARFENHANGTLIAIFEASHKLIGPAIGK